MERNNAYLAITAFALSMCLGLVVANCPSDASLQPCTCDHFGINCMRVQSTTQLKQAFRSSTPATRDHKELWIQKTPIASFPQDVLGGFRFSEVHIELNSNLSSFTLDALTNSSSVLTLLSVHGNALQTFEFVKLRRFTDLVTLNLGGNRLTRIPDDAFASTKMVKLVLSGNPIRSIGERAFYSLRGLKELALDNTRLVTLGGQSLAMPWAHWELMVDISGSTLTQVDRTAFENFTPFSLDLSQNNLTTLEQEPFQGLMNRMYTTSRQLNYLPIIIVGGNPLTCQGCSYEWLVQYRQNPIVHQMLSGFRCTDGRGLISITNMRIGCRRTGWPFASIG